MIIARSRGLSFINTGSGSPHLGPQFGAAVAERQPAARFRLKVLLGFRGNCKDGQARLPTVQPTPNALYSTSLDRHGPQEETIAFSHDIFIEFERGLGFPSNGIDASGVVDAISLRELHSVANRNLLRRTACPYNRVGRRSFSCLTVQWIPLREGGLPEEVQFGAGSSHRNRDLGRIGSQKDGAHMPVHHGGTEDSARDIDRRRAP